MQTILQKAGAKPIGDLFDQWEQKILDETKKIIQLEKELFEFQLLYSTLVSKKERNKTAECIRKIRDRNWKKALKKANGDERKALSIFASSYDNIAS